MTAFGAGSDFFPIQGERLLHLWQHIPAGSFELPFAVDLLKSLNDVPVVPGSLGGRVSEAGVPARSRHDEAVAQSLSGDRLKFVIGPFVFEKRFEEVEHGLLSGPRWRSWGEDDSVLGELL